MIRLIAFLSLIVMSGAGVLKAQNKVLNDTLRKEVPKAIEELVKEYDRQVKAARNQIVDPPVLEIDGIVIDESMSKSGRDFYELFFNNWRKPTEVTGYYIKIKERPFRFNTTIIEVYYTDKLIYQAVLQRRYDDIVEMVHAAIMKMMIYVETLKQTQKVLHETIL